MNINFLRKEPGAFTIFGIGFCWNHKIIAFGWHVVWSTKR